MPSRQYVQAPTFTPLPYGLLSSLGMDIRTPNNPHWQSGVTYEVLCGGGDSTYAQCLVATGLSGDSSVTSASPPEKTPTSTIDVRGALPFTVYTNVDCSAVGFWDRAEEMVGTELTYTEQWQVERAFWTGQAGGQPTVYPHLAADTELIDSNGYLLQSAATITGTGETLDVAEAVGTLEAYMANCYDGVPVIHAPRALNATFARFGLLVRDGPRYRTPSGSIVVFGGGYLGTSPSGAVTPNALWIYATGSMFIYRSKPTVFRVRDSFDRSNNTVRAIAERTYVIGWDCCHFGVPITTGGVVAGAPGGPGL